MLSGIASSCKSSEEPQSDKRASGEITADRASTLCTRQGRSHGTRGQRIQGIRHGSDGDEESAEYYALYDRRRTGTHELRQERGEE